MLDTRFIFWFLPEEISWKLLIVYYKTEKVNNTF